MDEKIAKQQKTKFFFRRDPLTTVVVLVLIFLTSQLAAGFLVALYPSVQNWTDTQGLAWLESSTIAQFSYIVLLEIFTIVAVLRVLNWIKTRPARIGLVKPRWSDFGNALITFGLYILVSIAARLVLRPLLTGVDFEQEQQIGFQSAYGSDLLLPFVAIIILVPLAEEVLFRGFLFSSLRAKYQFWPSAVITGILFGIAHLQFGSGAPLLWAAAIDTFILSCFLCWLRERTGSLWPAVFLHAVKNSLAFLILFGPRFL